VSVRALLRPAVGITAALLIFSAGARAQAPARCDWVFTNTPATRIDVIRLPGGAFRTFLGAGVVAHCAGQNNQVAADSAEFYEDLGTLYLIGNARYREPRATVTSERMTHFQGEERLNAEGNVVATLQNGTVMRGPVADYYRATPSRPLEFLIATGRPQLSLVEQDAAGRPREPVIVDADRIRMDGDSLIYASGRVNITRTDIIANSDSAFVDSGSEIVRLLRSPRINGRGERPFTLVGDVIDLFSRDRQLERVVATPNGHATSEDLEIFADSIDMRITDERLSRAMAWGASRARAVSPERDILADSLDVIMPGQQLEEVRAIGDAFATSVPDTLRVISAERDWLEGDTIIVEFESVAATGEQESRSQARQLTATGEARSFYQMQGRDRTREEPSVNYVRGEAISVVMRDGEVDYVVVEGNATGMYLERATEEEQQRLETPATVAPAPTRAPTRGPPPGTRPPPRRP
jgi:lipopolysaccharide export system protein LptA